MVRLKEIILIGGTVIDMTDYDHFWAEERGYGGGSSPLIVSSFSEYVMKRKTNWPNRFVVFSKNKEMYGKLDPEGLHVEASDIVAFSGQN